MPYSNSERWNIVVGWGGTLGACPHFNTERDYDILTIDGIQYSGSDPTNSR
eukprot:SAG25_NODE_10591_length_328_cov_1.113537_1_plen_50_part_01